MTRVVVLFIAVVGWLPNPAAAQDPMVMAIQQMMASFQPGCQMGDANACGAMQYIGGMANQMDVAVSACQAGNAQACNDFNQLYAQMDGEYGRWAQANGMSAPAATGGVDPNYDPNYDPNNVLGPTHQDRMNAIAQFGAQNTQTLNNTMNRMDQQQGQFMSTLNQ